MNYGFNGHKESKNSSEIYSVTDFDRQWRYNYDLLLSCINRCVLTTSVYTSC